MGLIATFEAPAVDADTLLVFKLTAGDGTETLSDEDVRITVRNLATTAVAGLDHRVLEGEEVTLDGSGSLSTTGDLAYLWTQTTGTIVGVTGSTDSVVTFTAPVLWGHTEELTFQLEVNDGAGGVSTDEVVIKVLNLLTASVFDLEPIDEPAGWQFYGSANYDDAAGILEITPTANSQTGAAFLTETIDCTKFRARFKLYIGDGDGADGMVFGWLRGPSLMGATGGSLGWYGGGLSGYGIVFDTYPNPAVNMVSFEDPEVHTAGDTGGYVSYTPPIDMENAGWFDVEIEMDNGHLQMWMSNEAAGFPKTLALDYTVVGYTGFDAYFGFTGATGGLNNNHWVDDLPTELADAYATRALPVSYASPGTVNVQVSVRADPDNLPTTIAVKEILPEGVTVADAGGGTEGAGTLTWTFDGVSSAVISYSLSVPAGSTAGLAFAGDVNGENTLGDTETYAVPSAPVYVSLDMTLGAQLSWSPPPEEGADAYRVYRSVDGGDWEQVAFTRETSYSEGVLEGSTYSYKVLAVNKNGVEGPFCDATEPATVNVPTIREAENYNYGGGLYPGAENCPAANRAPDSATVETPEDYDFYFDDTVEGDARNFYRPNDSCAMEIREATPNIGWTTPGDWWRYTFDVPEPGPEDSPEGWARIGLKVASPASSAIELYWDEGLLGSVTFATGDWAAFRWYALEDPFRTTPGQHTLRVKLASGEMNIDAIGLGFNLKISRQAIFEDDFEDYTNLYDWTDLETVGNWDVTNGANEPLVGWRLWNTAGDYLGDETEDRHPAIAGMTGNYVITDSDLVGTADLDEELVTPDIDCTDWIRLKLDFSKNFRVYPDDYDHSQIAEVDIRVWDADLSRFGDWDNLLHFDIDSVDPDLEPALDSSPEKLDLSAYDGETFQLRWHFYDAKWDWWFAVDNIMVSGEPKPEEVIKGVVQTIGIAEGNLTLTWNTFGNETYYIEHTTDLASGVWDEVAGPLTVTSSPPILISGSGAFYRIRSE